MRCMIVMITRWQVTNELLRRSSSRKAAAARLSVAQVRISASDLGAISGVCPRGSISARSRVRSRRDLVFDLGAISSLYARWKLCLSSPASCSSTLPRSSRSFGDLSLFIRRIPHGHSAIYPYSFGEFSHSAIDPYSFGEFLIVIRRFVITGACEARRGEGMAEGRARAAVAATTAH